MVIGGFMDKNYLKKILVVILYGLIMIIPLLCLTIYNDIFFLVLFFFLIIALLLFKIFFKNKEDIAYLIIIIAFILSLMISLLFKFFLVIDIYHNINMENLQLLYLNNEFITSIIKNFLICYILLLIGFSSIFDLTNIEFYYEQDLENIRNMFLNNKEISLKRKKNINQELFNSLRKRKIIIEVNDKYSYSLDKEYQFKKNNILVIMSIIIIMIIASFLIFNYMILKNNKKNIANNYQENNQEIVEEYEQLLPKIIDFKIKSSYSEFIDEEKEGTSWFYIPKKDLSGDSGYINVYYLKEDTIYSIDLIAHLKKEIEKDGGMVVGYSYFKNNYDLDVLSFIWENGEYTDYIYYIFGNNGYIGGVDIMDFNNSQELQKDGLDIVKNFKWNN